MITEDYVNSKQAQKLKEKGFDGECTTAYQPEDNDTFHSDHPENWNIYKDTISIPTHQMVLKWFRKKNNIHIYIEHYEDGGYSFMVRDHIDPNMYDTHEEATNAAIDYVLDNLI